jgi:hypothetical protein
MTKKLGADLKRVEGRGTRDGKNGRAKFLPSRKRQRLATGDWRLQRQKLLSAENFSACRNSALQKNHSPLTTHHSPLAVRYSPLTIRHSLLAIRCRFPCCPLLLLPRFSLPCLLLRRHDVSKRFEGAQKGSSIVSATSRARSNCPTCANALAISVSAQERDHASSIFWAIWRARSNCPAFAIASAMS